MIQMSLGSLLIIAGLLLSFFAYVASVSYKMGSLATRVENNESDIAEMKKGHATQADVTYIKQSLRRMEKNIGKLFDRSDKNRFKS